MCALHVSGVVTQGDRSHAADWKGVAKNTATIRTWNSTQPLFVYQVTP